jgi:hypothetical protein
MNVLSDGRRHVFTTLFAFDAAVDQLQRRSKKGGGLSTAALKSRSAKAFALPMSLA